MRGAPRFTVETLFLAALAAALAFAHLRAAGIVGVMLAGWVLVALFEWGALRQRAHFGSGLPPRWHVPQRKLPPPRPLEQVLSGYPSNDALIEEATWIASPAMLADWPVAEAEPAAGEPKPRVDEDTQIHEVFEIFEEESFVVEVEEIRDEPVYEEPEVMFEKHRIDPFERGAVRARRWSRRVSEDVPTVSVPARPRGLRPLPSRSNRDD